MRYALLLSVGLTMVGRSHAQAPFISLIESPDSISARFPVLYEAAGGDLVIMEATIQFDVLPWYYRIAQYRFTADGTWLSTHEAQAGTGLTFWPGHALELPDGSTAMCGGFENDGFYLRMAADGTVLSARTYSHPYRTELMDMALLDDSTLLMVGRWEQGGVSADAVALRTDLNGVLQESWSDSLFGTHEFHRVVRTAPDGSVWLAGEVSNAGADRHVHVMKTDAAGTVLWTNSFPGYWLPQDLHVLPSGAALLLADHNPSDYVMETDLIKIAPDGTPLGHTRVVADTAAMQGYRAISLAVNGADVRVTAWNDGQNVVMHADTNAVIQPVANTSDQTLMLDVGLQWFANGDLLLLAARIPHEVQIVFGRVGPLDDPLCGGVPDTLVLGSDPLATVPGGTRVPFSFTEQDLTSLFVPDAHVWTLSDVCPTVAVNAPAAAPALSAMPNPAMDEVRLSGPRMHALQLVDATGRTVRAESFAPLEQVSLPLTGLPPGLYTVRAHTDRGWRVVRVVKE